MISEDYIQGGGTLNDWANLSKYAESHPELKQHLDVNTVVCMGNSITEGWYNFKEDFLVSIFELIKDRKLRMMPTSSEIKVFLKKNREYMDLLPVGVRL